MSTATMDRTPPLSRRPVPSLLDPWNLESIKPHAPYVGMPRELQAVFVEHTFERLYPSLVDRPEPEGCCLYWAHAACMALRHCGHRAILQAGSMHWPIIPIDPEDERANMFGYEFSPHEAESAAAIETGKLPEVHIWCALPDLGEHVDFSTRNLKAIAERKYNLTWESPEPPRYCWGKAADFPENVIYAPSLEAIKFVLLFIRDKEATR